MKVAVVILGFSSLIHLMVYVDVKHHERRTLSELRSCVKVAVVALSSPSLIHLMVCVNVKHHER